MGAFHREVVNHITANYLPLVVRKQLGLYYCFIEPDVPVAERRPATRLQQVISNLLSNAGSLPVLAACVIAL